MTNALSKTANDESKAFFAKMVADYNRYICEVTTGERFETAKMEARKYYDEASAVEMQPCSSVKLGLALNQSVFYFEVLKDKVNACKFADAALN